jgi:rhodanese-related sulfurtransferase
MPSDVDLLALDRLLASGAVLVEVLPTKEFEDEHLPDAINIPLRTIDASTIASLDRGRAVVVYCWDSL